jgi:hypothetical protein
VPICASDYCGINNCGMPCACLGQAFCQGTTCIPCGSNAGDPCCPGRTCNIPLQCFPGSTLAGTCDYVDMATGPDDLPAAGGWTRSTFAPGTLNGVWGDSITTVAVGTQGMAGAPRIYRKISPATTFSPDTDPDTHDLYAVWGAGSAQTAVGAAGTVLQYSGSTWSAIPTTTTSIPATNKQNGVWMSASDIWIAGGNVATPGSDPFNYTHFNSTWATIGATGYSRNSAWGDGAGFVIMPSTDGMIFYSSSNGASWSSTGATVPKGVNLRKAWGADKTHVWIVGDSGYVYFFNGSALTLDTQFGGAPTLYGISGTSTSDIWAVGDSGVIYHNDGIGWTKVSTPSIMPGDVFKDVMAVGASDVYVVGAAGSTQLILHGP